MKIRVTDIQKFAPGARKDILLGLEAEAPAMLHEFQIDTPMRIAHFMAQIAHESDGFRTTEEYASGRAYEGRKDIGNVRRGDGRKFKGRGLIQCTGRGNYTKFTEWAQQRYPDAPDFVNNPKAVGDFPWALLSAVWYWYTRGLNFHADNNDLRKITRRINGGYNGLANRQVWFQRAWEVWGKGADALHATRGKKVFESTTVGAAVGSAAIAVGAVAAATDQVKEIGGTVEKVFGWAPSGDLVFWILLVAVVGLAVWIIRERRRKSREYKI